VRLVSELLETRFGKDMSFASDGVVVLDPAAGTGTYPLAVMQHALEHVSGFYGEGMRSQYATSLSQNIHAFEFLVGPYAVAHLRVTQKILAEGGQLSQDGVHVYLADTLESPKERPMERHGLLYRRLTNEHKRAQKVKQETRVLVCIGNPPYDRQQRDEDQLEQGVELKGGWVRFGEQNLNFQFQA
jgi:predicted helicase